MIYESSEFNIIEVKRYDLDAYANLNMDISHPEDPPEWVITVQRLPIETYPQTSEFHTTFAQIHPEANASTFIEQALPLINSWFETMAVTAHLENDFPQTPQANLVVMYSE